MSVFRYFLHLNLLRQGPQCHLGGLRRPRRAATRTNSLNTYLISRISL